MIKKTDGFTLVEILIALAIFAVIAMVMVSVLGIILQARHRVNAATQRMADLEVAFIIMQQDFSQMVESPINNTAQNNTIQKVASPLLALPHYIKFTRINNSNIVIDENSSNLQHVAYYVQGANLVRETWHDGINDTLSQAVKKIVLRDIKQFNISYLSSGKGFSSNWPPPRISSAAAVARNDLPRAVKIDIQFQNLSTIHIIYLTPTMI